MCVSRNKPCIWRILGRHFEFNLSFLTPNNANAKGSECVGGIGWILMIVIGGVAGLVASRIMNRNHSLTGNVVLGILGAVGMNAILSLVFGIHLGGLFGQLLVAVAGAVAIIFLFQIIRKNRD